MARYIHLLCIGLIGLTACYPHSRHSSVLPTGSRYLLPTSTHAPGSANSPRSEMQNLAIQDLTIRLSIDPKFVSLIRTESTVWSDSSLGCPRQEALHDRSSTEGYLIQLEANGSIYEYHTDTRENLVLCNPIFYEKQDGNVEDGWPNQTRDKNVIILTPTKKP